MRNTFPIIDLFIKKKKPNIIQKFTFYDVLIICETK